MKKGKNVMFAIPGESDELLSRSSVKDICQDGSILKKILKEGEKWENPKAPDEILVNYEARLEDGTVVSKSEGVEFTVKDGCFCPALAKAVKTMKKAEKVLLTVKPQYGFGEKGRPASGEEGAVPPNATLLIDLELASWKTVTEIGDDKKILKKVLKEGKGYERPNEGAVVKAKITGKLQDGTVFTCKGMMRSHLSSRLMKEVIDGLDLAVLNMKKGEVALVTIPPEYAFGSTESKQDLAVVPPNSTVIYEVDLVSFVKDKESWDLNNEEKIEAAGKNKEEGNAPFKLGKYARASKCYEKVDASLESLLKSLDLKKYLINFQEEEVDMKAMTYMNEEDMKALGIPMGPRKKILSALEKSQLSSTVQVSMPVREISDMPVQKRDPPPSLAPPVIKKVTAPAPVPAPPAPALAAPPQ